MNDMSNTPRTAKIFWSGRSQAVRLPKEFRFEGTEVRIRQDGDRVILEPADDKSDWGGLSSLSPMDDDAVTIALDRPGADSLPEALTFD